LEAIEFHCDLATRISLSWNISTGKIAGSPLPEVEAQREKLAAEK